MRKLLWLFGWAGVAVWSLVCALTYGFFDLVGRLFMRNADAFSASPDTVEGLWRFFSLLHGFSTGAVLVVWAVVCLLILAVPWTLDRLAGSGNVRVTRIVVPDAAGPFRGPFARPAPDPARYPGPKGVIDLAPDQYTVRSVASDGADARGSVPPVPPRG